jgi:hypothetical protein
MYPNPADRMVVFRNQTKGNIRITICDITGKYIAGVTQDPGDATYTVEELGLSAGMYIVTIRVGDVLRNERLLVSPSQ